MNDLYKRLIEYRDENKLTNIMLAKKLDVPENYIYRWAKKGISGIYSKYVTKFIEQ